MADWRYSTIQLKALQNDLWRSPEQTERTIPFGIDSRKAQGWDISSSPVGWSSVMQIVIVPTHCPLLWIRLVRRQEETKAQCGQMKQLKGLMHGLVKLTALFQAGEETGGD